MPDLWKRYSVEWKNLGNNQKLSLIMLVFLLIILPISLTLIVDPKDIFKSKAGFPATPPTTPPMPGNASVLAVLYNDANNNLELDNNEELINSIDAIVWICKLDQYYYACDMRYPLGVGRLYYRSNFEILNIYPGLNQAWITTYNAYPEHWYTPFAKPVLLNVSEYKQYIALLPMSKNPYPNFPTNSPPIVTPTTTPCSLTGDANGDCEVNLLDYVILRTNFGRFTGGGKSDADFNSSGRVDGLDYAIWHINFGRRG